MFEISEGDLPIVRTRQALLILDLQNDLVSTGCILPVDNPPDFIDKIIELVPQFRRYGNIIWVRSEFDKIRPVNDGSADGERIITDNELPAGSTGNGGSGRQPRMPSKSLLALYDKILAAASEEDDEPSTTNAEEEPDEPYDNEAFLTPELGKKPQCLLPLSLGSNPPQVIAQLPDLSKDTFCSKTYYSAFKDSGLLQTLRGQFVTELFICGVLTNISVFATAMDAVRFGYSITLVEDCLGYRSKARHDEAIRQMVETTGCALMTSAEIAEDIKGKESMQRAPSRPLNRPSRTSHHKRPVRDTQDQGNLSQMITNLKLRNDANTINDRDRDSTGNASVGPYSGDLPSIKTEGDGSNESLQSVAAKSDESLPDVSSPSRKPDGDPKKRVPNKIKTRRRSKSNLKVRAQDSEPNKASNSEADRRGPVSPTKTVLTKAAEALEKIPITQSQAVEPIVAEQVVSSTVDKGKYRSGSTSVQKPENMIEEIKNLKVAKHDNETNKTLVCAENSPQVEDSQSNTEDDSFAICDGYSRIIHNLLAEKEARCIFEMIRDEVRWQRMSHQGGEVPRLVAVQGEIDEDGSVPIYRHPADESPPLLPFSPAVTFVKSEVEKRLGHKVNHCLIQFYRSGTDYISEHSDKTLDIAPDTFIANVSFGAVRTMTFRTKKALKGDKDASKTEETTPRMSCKAPLPHNSMCKMSLKTNEKWLHGIRQDKRRTAEKSEAELAYNGGRISLTFRLIGTFLDRERTRMWGQGATAKEKKESNTVKNGETPEAEKMLRAFGQENHSSDFNWHEVYGEGFNVLHLSNRRRIFLSGDSVSDLRVKLALSEYDLSWSVGELSSSFTWEEGSPDTNGPEIPERLPLRLVDNDLARARVEGDVAIILYLDASYGIGAAPKSQVQKARQYTRLLESSFLLQKWREQPFKVESFRKLLALWDVYATEDTFIAGPKISVADLAFWPVLHEIVNGRREGIEYPNLSAYYERVKNLNAVRKAIIEEVGNDEKSNGNGKRKEQEQEQEQEVKTGKN